MTVLQQTLRTTHTPLGRGSPTLPKNNTQSPRLSVTERGWDGVTMGSTTNIDDEDLVVLQHFYFQILLLGDARPRYRRLRNNMTLSFDFGHRGLRLVATAALISVV